MHSIKCCVGLGSGATLDCIGPGGLWGSVCLATMHVFLSRMDLKPRWTMEFPVALTIGSYFWRRLQCLLPFLRQHDTLSWEQVRQKLKLLALVATSVWLSSLLVYKISMLFCYYFTGLLNPVEVVWHTNSSSNCCLWENNHWNFFLSFHIVLLNGEILWRITKSRVIDRKIDFLEAHQ